MYILLYMTARNTLAVQIITYSSLKFVKATKKLQNLQKLFDAIKQFQIKSGDFVKFSGLLRIHELYSNAI